MFMAFRTACFVSLAAAAGMVSQQVVSKFSSACEEAEVVSLSDADKCCSADAFYRAGCFRGLGNILALAEKASDHVPVPESLTEATPSKGNGADVSTDSSDQAITEPEVPATVPQEPPTPVLAVLDQTVAEEPQAAEPAASVPSKQSPQVEMAQASAEEVPLPPIAQETDQPNTAPTIAPETTPPSKSPVVWYPVPPSHGQLASEESVRYADPDELVRQRATLRGEERRRRVETRKWLGLSPLRPNVEAFPYSSGPSRTTVVVVPLLTREDPAPGSSATTR
jgi:hypothetical protein